MRRLLRLAGAVAAAVLALAGPVSAHPLGNFTVNHLSRITAGRDQLRVRYVLDLAEIPAFALDRSLDAHGTPSRSALAAWAGAHARAIAPQLKLVVDGRPIALAPQSASVQARPGAGGLPTLYFTASFVASIGSGAHRVAYRDDTEPGRLGWKDVVAGAAAEPTDELRRYPGALLGSPRARTALVANVDASGRIVADASAGDEAAQAAPATAPLARSNALSDVLSKGASDPLVVLGALLLAVALGALHALEPGHGKTLLAVSLVGARATARQAVVLASALTIAHTAGVLALGVLVMLAAQWFVPEQIYPWITLGSGLFVTVLGARALANEIRRRLPFKHVHVHAHSHAHPHAHAHVHVSGEEHHTHDDHAGLDDEAHARAHAIPGTAPLTFRSAVLAAASGNVAPCPAALVVLLAAITLHQVGYGLALIVAFSVGLAAVLTVLGIAVVRGAAWLVSRPRFERAARLAPLVTAFVIAAVGAVMVGQGFEAQGIGVPVPLVAALVLAAIAGYAFAWHQHGPARELAA
jgi:nickel/cobalt transporter (NicO) family protein